MPNRMETNVHILLVETKRREKEEKERSSGMNRYVNIEETYSFENKHRGITETLE